MASLKETDERIEALDEKIKQLQARKRNLVNRKKAEDRKARTHRLIQIGGLVEKYADGEIDLEALEKYLIQYSGAIRNLKKQQ